MSYYPQYPPQPCAPPPPVAPGYGPPSAPYPPAVNPGYGSPYPPPQQAPPAPYGAPQQASFYGGQQCPPAQYGAPAPPPPAAYPPPQQMQSVGYPPPQPMQSVGPYPPPQAMPSYGGYPPPQPVPSGGYAPQPPYPMPARVPSFGYPPAAAPYVVQAPVAVTPFASAPGVYVMQGPAAPPPPRPIIINNGIVAGSPQADAKCLHCAMQGLGTDEAELVAIITRRSREQLTAVAQAYESMYHRSLRGDVSGDTSFNFRRILLGKLKPLGEYLADEIYEAVAGVGTKEWALIDIITQITPQEKALLIDAWNRKYRSEGSLADRVRRDTSFNFMKTLVRCIEVNRMPPGVVDQSQVQRDADELYHAGEGRLGTSDCVFIDILASRSAEHMQAVSQAYRQRHGHGIERAIEKETSGDYCHALLALVNSRPQYVANRIHDAICGLGTNDSLLIRMFLMNEYYLPEVARWYQKFFNESLEHAIRDDTSGHYKKFLVSMLHPY